MENIVFCLAKSQATSSRRPRRLVACVGRRIPKGRWLRQRLRQRLRPHRYLPVMPVHLSQSFRHRLRPHSHLPHASTSAPGPGSRIGRLSSMPWATEQRIQLCSGHAPRTSTILWSPCLLPSGPCATARGASASSRGRMRWPRLVWRPKWTHG